MDTDLHGSESAPGTSIEQERIHRAILTAGEIMGVASRLDAVALEFFLDSNPQDFRYEANCRAILRLCHELFENRETA